VTQRRFYLLRVLLYLGFSILLTWPLATKFSTHFPQGVLNGRAEGFGHERGVQQLNIWTIWWNADRVQHLGSDYWKAPIFHPHEGAFALSEPQPITMLLAPLVWMFPMSAVAYNVYLLISLTLNGLLAEMLLRHMKVAWLPALYGGLMVAALPFVHWQRDVIQLVPVWGIIWLWLSLSRLAELPTLWRGVAVGVAFSCIVLSCLYYALFAVMVSLVACWWLVSDRLLSLKFWEGLGVAIACAAILCGPLLVSQLLILQDDDSFFRTWEEVDDLSAYVEDCLWVWQSTWHGFPPIDPPQRGYWNMSPGWLVMALAVLGVCFPLGRRLYSRYRLPFAEIVDDDATDLAGTQAAPSSVGVANPDALPRSRGRWLGMLVSVAALSLILSCGTHLKWTFVDGWGAIDVHQFLVEYVPGYEQLRSPFRFGMLFQLAIMLLAAIGVDVFWNLGIVALRRLFTERIRPTERQFWYQVAWTWVMMAAIGMSLFEVGWHPVPLGAIASVNDQGWRRPAWVDWLIENTAENDVIAHLPFPAGSDLPYYEPTTDAMIWQMRHRRPMVNGYSGFFPKRFLSVRDACIWFPDEASLAALKEVGVRWCIVSRFEYQPFEFPGLQRVFSDEPGGIDIYQLE
jgi:hypothetical protein